MGPSPKPPSAPLRSPPGGVLYNVGGNQKTRENGNMWSLAQGMASYLGPLCHPHELEEGPAVVHRQGPSYLGKVGGSGLL